MHPYYVGVNAAIRDTPKCRNVSEYAGVPKGSTTPWNYLDF